MECQGIHGNFMNISFSQGKPEKTALKVMELRSCICSFYYLVYPIISKNIYKLK